MYKRDLASKLKNSISSFPAVTLTGPRQAGKTTLCREVFPDFEYISLESLDNRQEAATDPRGLLERISGGVIFDEIQRAPDLVSYIQEYIDSGLGPKKYVLTGSEQLRVTQSVNQSLAGRTAVLRLLPFSYREAYGQVGGAIKDKENFPLEEVLYHGFYPRVFADQQNPTDAYSSYVATYLERDVRSIANIRHMHQFESFIRLAAANVGQILDYTRFSNDVGVDQETIKAWLSVLEGGYICYVLRPHSRNYRKRLVKRPKLYFYDTGLAAYLIGIYKPDQLLNHPLKGMLFENFVVADLIKNLWHQADYRPLYFYRDSQGNEVDTLIEVGSQVALIEAKAGRTLSKTQWQGLDSYAGAHGERVAAKFLVYGGSEQKNRFNTSIVPYTECHSIIEEIT